LTDVGHLEMMTVASVASLRRCPASNGIGAPLHRNTHLPEGDAFYGGCIALRFGVDVHESS